MSSSASRRMSRLTNSLSLTRTHAHRTTKWKNRGGVERELLLPFLLIAPLLRGLHLFCSGSWRFLSFRCTSSSSSSSSSRLGRDRFKTTPRLDPLSSCYPIYNSPSVGLLQSGERVRIAHLGERITRVRPLGCRNVVGQNNRKCLLWRK